MREAWTDDRLDDLREDMNREFTSVREDMNREFTSVREEMRREFTAVREEMKGEFTAVREEMNREFTSVREEMRRGFDRVDADVRQLKSEVNDRFTAVDARFDALQRTLVIGFAALGGGLLASIAATILAVVLG